MSVPRLTRTASPRALVERLETRTLFSAPTQWNSRGPGGGGAFFAPSFSPFNSAELYAVTDMSGVFHSTNTGASWNLVPFTQLQGNRQSHVQFTSNPQILYSLDYSEGPHGVDFQQPKKSLDGGATWKLLTGWNSANTAEATYADPNATNNVIVSDYDTVYF